MATISRHFSFRSQNNEPRIFQVTGANQNTRKLLSTDLVNTNTELCQSFKELHWLPVKQRIIGVARWGPGVLVTPFCKPFLTKEPTTLAKTP